MNLSNIFKIVNYVFLRPKSVQFVSKEDFTIGKSPIQKSVKYVKGLLISLVRKTNV